MDLFHGFIIMTCLTILFFMMGAVMNSWALIIIGLMNAGIGICLVFVDMYIQNERLPNEK